MEIHRLRPEHLDGVLTLNVAEGWPELPEDPGRAVRILTAPGVTTVVAVVEGEVIGFVQLLSDGELVAYLASIAVDLRFRRRGVGRALVEESLRLGGGRRVDVLSEDASLSFYERFPHFRKPGYRLYPFHESGED